MHAPDRCGTGVFRAHHDNRPLKNMPVPNWIPVLTEKKNERTRVFNFSRNTYEVKKWGNRKRRNFELRFFSREFICSQYTGRDFKTVFKN